MGDSPEENIMSDERPEFVLFQVLPDLLKINALFKNLMKEIDTDDLSEAIRKINSGQARIVPASTWSIENSWWKVDKDATGKELDVAYISFQDLGFTAMATMADYRRAAQKLGLDFCPYEVAPPAESGKGYVKVILCEDVYLTKHKDTELYSKAVRFALCRPHKKQV